MNNNFTFELENAIILKNHGKTELRFFANTTAPYYKLPCVLWLLEKQMTGNNFYKKGLKLCLDYQPYRPEEYKNFLYNILNQKIIPKIKYFPLSEDSFNYLLIRTGLLCLNTAKISNIVLDENTAVIREIYDNAEFHENIKHQGSEILRYTIDDVCALNLAYKKSIDSSSNFLIKDMYNEIRHLINLNS